MKNDKSKESKQLIRQKNRKRVIENTNLTIYSYPSYMGMRVMHDKGYLLIEEYLNVLHKVLLNAVHVHPRTLAFRFELKFPIGYSPTVTGNVISKFFKNLRYRIQSDRSSPKKLGRVHDTCMSYVWAKEYSSTSNLPHFHVLLLLNNDAYRRPGRFERNDNLFSLIRAAWAYAIGLDYDKSNGLVHASINKKFDEPAYYCINMNAAEGMNVLEKAYWRSSYLCKSQTKHYCDRSRSFGSSLV